MIRAVHPAVKAGPKIASISRERSNMGRKIANAPVKIQRETSL